MWNIEHIPDGWEVVELGDVAEVTGGSTPSRTVEEFWDGGIAWAVPSELTELQGRYLTNTKESITEVGMKSAGLKLIPVGSVLLTSRATIGVTAINTMPVVTNQGFQNLIVRDGTDALWLHYCISACRNALKRRASGSTFQEVSRESVRSLPILLPPLPEQRSIAAVLDSIDEVVERTKQVISVIQHMRDALLHELLTYGVPGWHTKWQDAPGIGTIPADWEVVQLGDVSSLPQYGAPAKAREYDPSLPRYVRISDITDDGWLRSDNRKSADPTQVKGFELEAGDLLFARSGSVGRTFMYRTQYGACVFAGYLIRFRPLTHIVDPQFLEYWTHSKSYYRWVASMSRVGAQPNINASEYSSLPIPLPPLLEQRAIVAVFDVIDKGIAQMQLEKDRIQILKVSASDALLTGRLLVRNQ